MIPQKMRFQKYFKAISIDYGQKIDFFDVIVEKHEKSTWLPIFKKVSGVNADELEGWNFGYSFLKAWSNFSRPANFEFPKFSFFDVP